MASSVSVFVEFCSDILLSFSALYSSFKLFKNHRAPSAGFFVLGAAASFRMIHPFCSHFSAFIDEVKWTGKVLAPTLVSFDYLWISHEYTASRILLCGGCLLLAFSDWLYNETLMLMTRCLGLSCLSCCMSVCMFAGNSLGVIGGVAISLPLLMDKKARSSALFQESFSASTEEMLHWFLDGMLVIGCLISTEALKKFLSDVSEESNSDF